MIEQFSHEYDNFFEEPRCEVRWQRLRGIYSADYASFRVLFLVETMGLLDKWREPTPAELTALLRHKASGGRIAIRIGDVVDLFQPVWSLEIAKYEYLVYRATCDRSFRRRYFMTGIRSFTVALVQAWWAFETLMNDFASIIAKERRATLDSASLDLLEERRTSLDKAGGLAAEPYYQQLLPRLQFIYRLLTGEQLDRESKEWRHVVELKDTRDAYVHRVGKDTGPTGAFGDDEVLVNGFTAVRGILARVFSKTPEFAAKFVYKYLAFWSCGSEVPFIWDGSEGDCFYLGLGNVKTEAVTALFAPMAGSFSADRAVSVPASAQPGSPPAQGAGRRGKRRVRQR